MGGAAGAGEAIAEGSRREPLPVLDATAQCLAKAQCDFEPGSQSRSDGVTGAVGNSSRRLRPKRGWTRKLHASPLVPVKKTLISGVWLTTPRSMLDQTSPFIQKTNSSNIGKLGVAVVSRFMPSPP